MVRKIKEKAKKALKKAKQDEEQDRAQERGGPEPPARLKKKLLKKVAFLERLTANKPPKSSSAGVQKKKKRRPSIALGNFASLAESLQDAAKRATAGQDKIAGAAVNTLKARERIANEESERLQQVLSHPQFQADPLAAIASHLEATLPPPPEPPKPKLDARQKKIQKKMKKQRLKMEQERNDMVS